MGYQTAHYNKHGNANNCVSYTMYVPDGGNLRSQITNVYSSLFGRWGEPGGVEGWVNVWNAPGDPAHSGFSSVYAMVLSGAAGELSGINANGRHTGLSAGGCPVYGCTNSLASNYNPNADIENGSCVYPTPSITYSISPTSIIQGQTATLNWSISSSTSRSFNQGIGSVASSGSKNVSDVMDTTIYTLSATYYSYTSSSKSLTLTVYEPVIANISSSPTAIVSGSSTTLQWTVTGSTSGNAIIDQAIGAVPFSANQSVSPTTTTIYTISASGPGGTDTDSATVVVYQKPQLTVNFPTNIEYGEAVSIPMTHRYSSSGVSIVGTYTYRDPTTGNYDDITISNYTLTGTSNDEDSAEISQNWSPNIPWNVNGPLRVNFTATANGNGGSAAASSNVYDVIVDLTPVYINVPISEDQLPSEPEVLSPDAEVVLSDPITIEDVDIAVEIKANKPIQVRFDDENTWNDVRQSSL